MNALLSKVGQHTIDTVDLPDEFSSIGCLCSKNEALSPHVESLHNWHYLFVKKSNIVIGLFVDFYLFVTYYSQYK